VTSESLVSVIIPTLNRAYCVADAVRSALEQSHPFVECIVVDDGSTDGTVRVLHDEFARDSRVRVFAREHAGVSGARNFALARASGRFVTFLDSDDLMTPRRVSRQLAALDEESVDAVIGREEPVLLGDAWPEWLEARPPHLWNQYYHMSMLVPTERVRDVGGFDETLDLGEDTDLAIRLVASGVRIAHLDEVIVTRRFFGDNVTYRMRAADHRELIKAVRRHLARQRARVDG
jgi:glycosyltransferase involved in cell wall biosynthesis